MVCSPITKRHREQHRSGDKEIHACSIRKAARQQKMTYNCVYAPASTDERFLRLNKLDKVSCGLAPLGTITTPTMDLIADCGVEPQDLGRGIVNNQQVVMPYYLAYKEVRKSVVEGSTVGPVETLRHGLFKDSSDWDEVKFVSENKLLNRWLEILLFKELDLSSWQTSLA